MVFHGRCRVLHLVKPHIKVKGGDSAWPNVGVKEGEKKHSPGEAFEVNHWLYDTVWPGTFIRCPGLILVWFVRAILK